jgi:hypothetical protein
MALTFPLTIPSAPGWVKKSLVLRHNKAVHRSPLSQVQQTLLRAGSSWTFAGELPPMTAVQARPWLAFLQGLRGGGGTFLLPVPDYSGPANGSATNGLVKGAAQTGLTLLGDGFAINQTPHLEGGEFFQVENQVYQTTADAETDGSGNATLEHVPEIRTSHADNAVINVLTPKVLMRAVNASAGWETDHRGLYFISILAEEVVA